MIQVLTILSIITLNITIVWLLFFDQKMTIEIRRLLALILFFVEYNQFVIWGFHNERLHYLAVGLTYTDALTFCLIAPLFYILMLKIIKSRPLFSIKNTLHIWPALGGFVYTIYFNSFSETTKHAIAHGDSCGALPDYLLFIFSLVSILVYIIATMVSIRSFINGHSTKINIAEHKKVHSIYWFLVICLLLGVSFGVLLFFSPLSSDVHFIMMPIHLYLSLAFLFLVWVIKPTSVNISQQSDVLEPTKNNDVEQLKQVMEKIQHYFEQKQPYLKTNLDLEKIAKAIKVPVYKISLAVKYLNKNSVPDYINNYRIEYAKKRLSAYEGKIDFLYRECGFTSRSSFYLNFKKCTGVTPLEYKESIQRNAVI